MKKYLMKTVRMIGFHGGILLRGFAKVMYGVITAMVATVAVYGFAQVSTLGGYAAVSSFLLSTCCTLAFLIGIYLMGIDTRKGAKR